MNDDKPEDNAQTGQQNPPAEEPAASQTDWQARFEAQRKVNRDLERKLNDAYKRADRSDELERKIAELEGKQAEWQQSKERERFQNEAIAQANVRVLKANVRASAAGRLADPSDALRYIDLSDLTVSDDGEVDSAAIDAKVDELIKQRPYLAKSDAKPAGPTGIVPPSGLRDGDTHKSQLTRDDLKHMSAAEIVKAKAEGRCDDLLGIKH